MININIRTNADQFPAVLNSVKQGVLLTEHKITERLGRKGVLIAQKKLVQAYPEMNGSDLFKSITQSRISPTSMGKPTISEIYVEGKENEEQGLELEQEKMPEVPMKRSDEEFIPEWLAKTQKKAGGIKNRIITVGGARWLYVGEGSRFHKAKYWARGHPNSMVGHPNWIRIGRKGRSGAPDKKTKQWWLPSFRELNGIVLKETTKELIENVHKRYCVIKEIT